MQFWTRFLVGLFVGLILAILLAATFFAILLF